MSHECDQHCEQLSREITPEVSERLIQHVSATPGVVGAMPISSDVIFAVVKGITEAAAKSFGDSAVNAILTQKDTIKKVIGDASLAALDKLIHGLEAAS